MKKVVSYKDSQGLTYYKMTKQATKQLINKARNDDTFNHAISRLHSIDTNLLKISSQDSNDDMSVSEYYSDDIADDFDEANDIMENLSDYAKKHYSHNDRAMYSGFDNTQRAYDLWNVVGDTMDYTNSTNTVDDEQDLLEDCGDIGNASQRHAMDKLDDMDTGAYCEDFGGGDMEYLDPDDASDMVRTFIQTIKNYQNGLEQIY